MENWFFLFLGLILAYLLDFTRPWVKSYFDKSALSSREKRIKAILEEYRKIRRYKDDASRLILTSIRGMAYGLMAFSISITGLLLSLLSDTPKFDEISLYAIPFYLGVFVSSLMVYQGVILPIRNMLDFETYTEKTRHKIQKLGGSPEDLDKEENE